VSEKDETPLSCAGANRPAAATGNRALGPLDALIHLGNLILPALGLGMIAAALAKLAWWRALAGVAWWRLAAWAAGAATVASVSGLVVTGRDGRMGTYAAMVVATALALWWAGWVRGARR
jgi:hypothetical protein